MSSRPLGRVLAGSTSLLAIAALGAGFGITVAPASAASSGSASLCPDATTATLGPFVCVFGPAMSQSAIQADLNAIAISQVPLSAQFNSNRYAVFFEPGTYGTASSPLVFQVGYYEEVAGLGAMPQDVVVNGQIDAFANALDCPNGPTGFCWENSTVNFWRSLSNLELNVHGNPAALNSPPLAQAGPPINNPGAANCYGGGNDFWSVSQASPLRRLLVNGNIVFQAFCTATNFGGTDFASGGFNADDQVNGQLLFLGNQQYITRNSTIGGAAGCPNGLWNNVYSGVNGVPTPVFSGTCQQNTVLAASPRSEEKPFLTTDSSGANWSMFVPAVQSNSAGTTWAGGTEAGASVPLSSFFVASPSTPVGMIDAALARGSDLLFTPGIYALNSPIVVSHPGTVVMGLGLATLVPQNGTAALTVLPDSGVKLSGLIVDAGPVNSPVLMSVGSAHSGGSGASDPDLVSDVFFRIGGAETTPTSATVSLVDNADDSILDDIWGWRADHNLQGTTGWTYNRGDTGVIVAGDNVTAYGLFVEHYQKSEVIWSGQNGTDVFFQNELPYDPPSQAAWEVSPTQLGYPAFLVTSNVTSFHSYGMGSYVVFISTPAAAGSNSLFDTEPFQVPTTDGVLLTNTLTVWIAGNGGDLSIVNGVGGPDTSINPGTVEPVDVASFI